jgi:hypothetical protein
LKSNEFASSLEVLLRIKLMLFSSLSVNIVIVISGECECEWEERFVSSTLYPICTYFYKYWLMVLF